MMTIMIAAVVLKLLLMMDLLLQLLLVMLSRSRAGIQGPVIHVMILLMSRCIKLKRHGIGWHVPHHASDVLVLVPRDGDWVRVRTDVLNEGAVTPIVLSMQQVTAFAQHHVVDSCSNGDGGGR